MKKSLFASNKQRYTALSIKVASALLLLLTLLALSLVVSACSLGRDATKAMPLASQTFSVSSEPQIIINDFAGVVTLQASGNGSVSVNETEHVSTSSANDIQYSAVQQGNTIKVTATRTGASTSNAESVDLTLTLPALCDIQASTGAGNITANGLSGLMKLQTNAGDLSFQGGTIKGASSLQSHAGTITFDGSLAPAGDYEFTTNAGSINLTLPADSAFTLNASTNAGGINNAFSSNTVGSNPTSSVHAHTNAGDVNIYQKA